MDVPMGVLLRNVPRIPLVREYGAGCDGGEMIAPELEELLAV